MQAGAEVEKSCEHGGAGFWIMKKSCSTCRKRWRCLESDREYACREYEKKARKRNERGKKNRVYESAESAKAEA